MDRECLAAARLNFEYEFQNGNVPDLKPRDMLLGDEIIIDQLKIVDSYQAVAIGTYAAHQNYLRYYETLNL